MANLMLTQYVPHIGPYYNLQNQEKGKSSNVEVSLASAFLEETVQFGIKSDTTTIHGIIGVLHHRTNRVCVSCTCNMIKIEVKFNMHIQTCTWGRPQHART